MEEKRPNDREVLFLNLAYNAFYDLYYEVMTDSFWKKEADYRFTKIREGLLIYSELLEYEIFERVFFLIKNLRPPMEEVISRDFFNALRNLLIHFPVFKTWDDVWFSSDLINWSSEGKSLDKFFRKYEGHDDVKYRTWDAKKKKMSYVQIKFPNNYTSNSKTYLKSLLEEVEGIKFSYVMMKKVLDTQVEKE